MFTDDKSPKLFDVKVRPEAVRRLSPDGITGFVVTDQFTNWTHSASALAAPALYGPVGYEIVADARPEFKFSLDPEFTEFQFILTKGEEVMYSRRVLAPGRFWNDATKRRDLVVWRFPYCVGDVFDGKWFAPDATYGWTVTAYSPALYDGVPALEPGSFKTAATAATDSTVLYAPAGKGSVSVNVKYPSAVLPFAGGESYFIRVQAFRSKSFNGLPDASMSVTSPGTYKLTGLEAGESYYLRTYIEQGGDAYARDNWESWGYYRAGNSAANPYTPVAVKATTLGNASAPYAIAIRDCDTDNDLLPDAYEWAQAGNLLALGVADYAPTVKQTMAYAAMSPLAIALADPLCANAGYDQLGDNGDVDGDGISNRLESELGFSATTPQTLKITSVAFDANGNPVLDWTWDGTASTTKGRSLLKMGRQVAYEVQGKVALTDPEWTTIRTVYTDEIDGQAVVTEEGAPAGVDVKAMRFFRIKFGTK